MNNVLHKTIANTNVGIRTAFSDRTDAPAAVQDIWQQLQPDNAACVVFFCSPDYPLESMAAALRGRFADTPLLGCTTAGEITPCGLSRGSITAFCLPSSEFVVETLHLNNLATFSAEQVHGAVRDKLERLQRRAINPAPGSSFVLSLLDGMAIREELVLRALNDALDGIPLLGGSAGDNLNFGDTYVFWQGEFHSGSAALIMVNTLCPFEVISSHHFSSGADKLVVTSADPGKRVAREINAEPAALEYCRVAGLTLDELGDEVFASHPLAVRVGDSLYVRSIQKVNDDLSLTFFCAVDSGIVLTTAEDSGMVEHFDNVMRDVVAEIGTPQLVIGCDCIHRCIEARQKGLTAQLSALYQQYQVVGFNTYGEQFNGLHINHSFTGIAIGSPVRPGSA